jgi:hypothetical protein
MIGSRARVERALYATCQNIVPSTIIQTDIPAGEQSWKLEAVWKVIQQIDGLGHDWRKADLHPG